MTSNNRSLSSVGADYADSKHQTDNEIDLSTVTLSRSEGSVSMVVEMPYWGSVARTDPFGFMVHSYLTQ
jgi:hypothetical protein